MPVYELENDPETANANPVHPLQPENATHHQGETTTIGGDIATTSINEDDAAAAAYVVADNNETTTTTQGDADAATTTCNVDPSSATDAASDDAHATLPTEAVILDTAPSLITEDDESLQKQDAIVDSNVCEFTQGPDQ